VAFIVVNTPDSSTTAASTTRFIISCLRTISNIVQGHFAGAGFSAALFSQSCFSTGTNQSNDRIYSWQGIPGHQSAQIAQFTRSAALSASSRAVSLNGLNRHSTAPSSSSRGRTVLSVLAVMKMIGISCPRSFNSR
jgi:hypothetical protein